MRWSGARGVIPVVLVWMLVAACDDGTDPGPGGDGGTAGSTTKGGTTAQSGGPSSGGAPGGGRDSNLGDEDSTGGTRSEGGAGADGGRDSLGGTRNEGGDESGGDAGADGGRESHAGTGGNGGKGGTCDPNACHNAALCTPLTEATFECDCLFGGGDRCERSIDVCAALEVPCDPLRPCRSAGGVGVCSDCPPPYTNLGPDRCQLVSCETEGDCEAHFGGLAECSTGWRCNDDNQCEIQRSECTDADGDGAPAGEVCVCGEVDCNDSDASVGNRVACYSGPTGTAGIGVCRSGSIACGSPDALCFGERLPSGETCNAEDDDCNGAVDDVPAIQCGLGVCARSVPGCTSGQPSACVPGNPPATTDGCDGLDDDCDGVVDEDCTPCLQVTKQGNDAAAAASDAATPFASVQAAIDFAATQREPGSRICVAAGPSCGATTSFAGPAGSDLRMQNGVHLYANYESSSWTRCADSTTRLVPATGRGVTFGADVVSTALLDGFTIDRLAGETSVGVSVIGARGVVLRDVSILEGPTASISYGVNLEQGAEARIVSSRIEAGAGSVEAIGVRAVDSQLAIEDSCESALDARGRCVASRTGRELPAQCTSSQGPSIRGPKFHAEARPERGHAVLLQNSPHSRIERSTLCAEFHGPPSGAFSILTSQGASDGTVIRASSLAGSRRGEDHQNSHGIDLVGCSGAPRVEGSELTLLLNYGSGDALRASGDCHPVVDSSSLLIAGIPATLKGMQCEAAEGVPSACVLSNSQVLVSPDAQTSTTAEGVGLDCRGGSCARIVNNYIVGNTDEINAPGVLPSSMNTYRGVGIALDGGTAFVSGNEVRAGCGSSMTGMRVNGARSRIENNLIFGASGTHCNWPGELRLLRSTGLSVSGGAVDLHSNLISGATFCNVRPPDPFSSNVNSDNALSISSVTVARNNLIVTGACGFAAGVFAGSTPTAFQHNNITPGSVLYEGAGPLINGISAVNALDPTRFFGNISEDPRLATDGWHLTADSPGTNSGTPAGAPLRDRDSELRNDGAPDIGPDEVH